MLYDSRVFDPTISSPKGATLQSIVRQLAKAAWLAAAVAISLPPAVSAADTTLTWRETMLAKRAPAAAKTVTAEFRFHNSSPQAVRIVSVKTSCDCLSASTDKESYALGEEGVVHAEFAASGRQGRQEKAITLATDVSSDAPAVLRLVIEMPEPVAVAPRSLSWQVGESTAAKDFELVVADPAATTFGDVLGAKPIFDARVLPADKSGVYRLRVAPASTAEIAQSTIRLNATVNGQSRVFVFHAAVK